MKTFFAAILLAFIVSIAIPVPTAEAHGWGWFHYHTKKHFKRHRRHYRKHYRKRRHKSYKSRKRVVKEKDYRDDGPVVTEEAMPVPKEPSRYGAGGSNSDPVVVE